MKRIISILLSLSACLSLYACGMTQPTTPPTEVQTAPPTEAPVLNVEEALVNGVWGCKMPNLGEESYQVYFFKEDGTVEYDLIFDHENGGFARFHQYTITDEYVVVSKEFSASDGYTSEMADGEDIYIRYTYENGKLKLYEQLNDGSELSLNVE